MSTGSRGLPSDTMSEATSDWVRHSICCFGISGATKPRWRTQLNQCRQVSASLRRVRLFPKTMKPRRARVKATLILALSDVNPTRLCGLERTVEKMITSFSLPWYESTEATSTDAAIGPWAWSRALIRPTCARYGEMIPMSTGCKPASRNATQHSATASTSCVLKVERPSESSRLCMGTKQTGFAGSGQGNPAGDSSGVSPV